MVGEGRRDRSILAFLVQSLAIFFTTLSDVTDADKIVNPKHFDSDPADIRLTLDVLAEVLRSLNTV